MILRLSTAHENPRRGDRQVARTGSRARESGDLPVAPTWVRERGIFIGDTKFTKAAPGRPMSRPTLETHSFRRCRTAAIGTLLLAGLLPWAGYVHGAEEAPPWLKQAAAVKVAHYDK